MLKMLKEFSVSTQIPFSLPWNQTTYLGYAGEISIDVMVTVGYLIANGSLLLFFMSMCIYHRAFLKIFEHSVDNLDAIKGRNKEKCVLDLIRFHISTKKWEPGIDNGVQLKMLIHVPLFFQCCRWFIESAKIYSPFIILELICCTIIMAIVILYFDRVNIIFCQSFHQNLISTK